MWMYINKKTPSICRLGIQLIQLTLYKCITAFQYKSFQELRKEDKKRIDNSYGNVAQCGHVIVNDVDSRVEAAQFLHTSERACNLVARQRRASPTFLAP